ncbi:MAG: hypothetical protein GY816_10900, partial [Cytophagales bacterium]|nr:hypothetical protein [Cytophagales bacterium]
RNENINEFFKANISPICGKSTGPWEREQKAERMLAKLNKGPLLEMTMKIWREYELCRQFVTQAVEFYESNTERKQQDVVEVPVPEMKIFDKHLKEVERKLTDWGSRITSEMKGILEREIPEALPQVTKDAVKEISSNTKFMKPWNKLFKKSQGELKEEANKTFRTTLKTALNEFQHEIISTVQQKHDVDMFEKERRICNFVIEKCPESTKSHPTDRLKHDIEFVKNVTGLDDASIVKCIRGGPRDD